MKPRFTEKSYETSRIIEKAREINNRLNNISKKEDEVPKEKITDINPHFVAESGGQTKSGYYTSNGNTIDVEDAPKRAKHDTKVDLSNLGGRMNPHAGTGAEREDSKGGEVKKTNPKASLREDAEQGAPVACKTCGGTPRSGCGLHDGMDIFACNQFSPL